jgi:hypothetical protein
MPYSEIQLLFTSLLTNFELQINNRDLDQSLAIMTYTKYDATFSVLETKEVRITGGEVRAMIPDVGKTLTILADVYNPYNPKALLPLSLP